MGEWPTRTDEASAESDEVCGESEACCAPTSAQVTPATPGGTSGSLIRHNIAVLLAVQATTAAESPGDQVFAYDDLMLQGCGRRGYRQNIGERTLSLSLSLVSYLAANPGNRRDIRTCFKQHAQFRPGIEGKRLCPPLSPRRLESIGCPLAPCHLDPMTECAASAQADAIAL